MDAGNAGAVEVNRPGTDILQDPPQKKRESHACVFLFTQKRRLFRFDPSAWQPPAVHIRQTTACIQTYLLKKAPSAANAAEGALKFTESIVLYTGSFTRINRIVSLSYFTSLASVKTKRKRRSKERRFGEHSK